jgi:hypothetical protein
MAPNVSSRQRPDLLSPCRGHLRPGSCRSSFDRKPRLWPDCRFVADGVLMSRLPLGSLLGPKRKLQPISRAARDGSGFVGAGAGL